MSFIQQVQGLAQRFLPAPIADQNPVNVRTSRYGDLMLTALTGKKQFLADEGSFFVTTNPTPGTALAGTVSATYDATKPCFVMQNLAPVGGPRAYLDYMKLIPTVIPASGTTAYFAIWRDQISTAITTNHVTQTTPVNVNGDAITKPNVVWQVQSSATASVVAALSPQSALVARGSFSSGFAATGIVIGDEMVIDFGSTNPGAFQGATAVNAVPHRYVSCCPPVICAPQQQLFVYMWFASNSATGPSYEFEFTHWER